MKRFLTVVAVLLCIAIAYLAAAMLDDPDTAGDEQWLVGGEQVELPAISAQTSDDARLLARAFGASVPVFSGARLVSGEVRQARWTGGRAYVLTQQMEISGLPFTLSCVRPADAAPLLLRDELALRVAGGGLSVLSMPCAVAGGADGALCLYFASEDAAYSLYSEQMEETAFLALPGLATGVQAGDF